MRNSACVFIVGADNYTVLDTVAYRTLLDCVLRNIAQLILTTENALSFSVRQSRLTLTIQSLISMIPEEESCAEHCTLERILAPHGPFTTPFFFRQKVKTHWSKGPVLIRPSFADARKEFAEIDFILSKRHPPSQQNW